MKPVFVTVVGSYLYGMNVETSDKDIKGFCFSEIDEKIGLKNFEQQLWDNGIEDGPEKIEGQIIDIQKYIGLCMKGNPTVIEIAFAPEKFWVFSTDIGLEVADFVRKNMLTQRLFPAYSAYHHAQLRKMESVTRIGKRSNEVEQYGFDRKFACHAYRLAKQCIMVLKDEFLNPTLTDDDLKVAMSMRLGTISKEEAMKYLVEVDREMYDCHKSTKLPTEPNFDKVNKWLVDLYLRYFNGEFDKQFKEFNIQNINL